MLNTILEWINKPPTGLCDLCGVEETVDYVIRVGQTFFNERE